MKTAILGGFVLIASFVGTSFVINSAFANKTVSISSFDDVTPQEAAALMAEDAEIVLIDVRTPREFGEVRIAEAHNIPLGETTEEELRSAGVVSSDTPIIVQCRSGNRSESAQRELRSLGYTNVMNLDGGIQAWEASGLPVER